MEEEGSRPPGLLVVGWSCETLVGRGEARWVTEDGFKGLEGLGGVEGLGMGLRGGMEGGGMGGGVGGEEVGG